MQIPATAVTDVEAAIRTAGVSVPDGRLLSVTGAVLNARAHPATIVLNGHPVPPGSPVHSGDVITFIRGADSLEPTRTIQQSVYLSTAAAALYTGYQPGVATVVQGTASGQQASYEIVRAPSVGRLRAPARLSLSFDDGPNGTFTTGVLQDLSARRVPAVFCLIGQRAQAEPELVRAELAAGGRLCNHTQTHPLNLPELPPGQIAAQISAGQQSLLHADGNVPPIYFRAPGGNWSPTVVAAARTSQLIPLRWTVDPKDWSRPGTATIVTRVLDQLRPDGIVLLHDGGGDRSQTVAVLTQLLDELTAAGWSFTFPTWIS